MPIEKEERRVGGMLTGGGLFCEFKTHKKNQGHPKTWEDIAEVGRHIGLNATFQYGGV
jgi:hypothetical protein